MFSVLCDIVLSFKNRDRFESGRKGNTYIYIKQCLDVVHKNI